MSPIAGGKRLLGAPAQSSAGSKGTAGTAFRGQQRGAATDRGIQSSPVVAGRVLSQQAPEAHAARAAVAIMQQSAARPAAAATTASRASGCARLPDAEDVPDAKDLEGDPLTF